MDAKKGSFRATDLVTDIAAVILLAVCAGCTWMLFDLWRSPVTASAQSPKFALRAHGHGDAVTVTAETRQ